MNGLKRPDRTYGYRLLLDNRGSPTLDRASRTSSNPAWGAHASQLVQSDGQDAPCFVSKNIIGVYSNVLYISPLEIWWGDILFEP